MQQGAAELPTTVFHGIPAEAFGRKDLLLMLRMTIDSVRREQEAHARSMKLMGIFAKAGNVYASELQPLTER